MKNFDIGLGTSPITFSGTDHRPTTGCLVQEWKNGRFQEVERVDLKERWPDKWAKEWFGWQATGPFQILDFGFVIWDYQPLLFEVGFWKKQRLF